MFPFSDKCLHCGSPTRGRSDKKFCDSVCKNRYHYLINKEKNELKPPLKKPKKAKEGEEKKKEEQNDK